MDDISLFEALYSTRSFRRFKKDPVPEEALWKVLEVATMAASGSNTQGWRFLVVRDDALRRRLAEMYAEVGKRARDAGVGNRFTDEAGKRLWKAVVYLMDHFDEAPVHIVVCGLPYAGGQAADGSVYAAMQNLALAARGFGLGTVITTLLRSRQNEVKELLGIPAEMDLVAVLPFGYPRGKYGRPPRQPVQEVTYWDRWGEQRQPA